MASDDSSKLTQEALGEPSGPCAVVIFGAGGDLTKRKLIPALYNLAKGKLLPENFAIVGVSREDFSTDVYRQRSTEEINMYSTSGVDKASWDWFVKRLYYFSGNFTDPKFYKSLGEFLEDAQLEVIGDAGAMIAHGNADIVCTLRYSDQHFAAGRCVSQSGDNAGLARFQFRFAHVLGGS